MGGPAGIDMKDYSANGGKCDADEEPKTADQVPGSPLEALFPYMRKCLYSVIEIVCDSGKDLSERTRLVDHHMAALCAIAYHYGKTGEKPDTLDILDDGSVVNKHCSEEKKEGE